jgi:hypothetical protein
MRPPTRAKGRTALMAESTQLASLQFRVSRECSVFVCFAGPVTQEAIDKFIEILQLSKDTYPKESEGAQG